METRPPHVALRRSRTKGAALQRRTGPASGRARRRRTAWRAPVVEGHHRNAGAAAHALSRPSHVPGIQLGAIADHVREVVGSFADSTEFASAERFAANTMKPNPQLRLTGFDIDEQLQRALAKQRDAGPTQLVKRAEHVA